MIDIKSSMAQIKVHDKRFGPFLSEQDIQQQVKKIADAINLDYAGLRPMFIAILNGSFMFASDLFKYLTMMPKYVLLNWHRIKEQHQAGR
jgi:hypoxanthine-guanine phosphoribosyltransferase